MKEFLNKSAWIKIRADRGFIYFTVKKVTSITNTHITFVDKFNNMQVFLISDVIQIKELNNQYGDNNG